MKFACQTNEICCQTNEDENETEKNEDENEICCQTNEFLLAPCLNIQGQKRHLLCRFTNGPGREGDEDEDLADKGFVEEEVGDDEEGEGAEDEVAGFNGNEHEVRERVQGYEERAAEVGSDRLVRCRFARPFRSRCRT
ncbi:hypothetical protein L3X38_033903 [Prunus dulcis]|uniref:Uncharacterized protein n=1 Tax=Prunus dulcis TaxID=3755 RepID=A0AAD4VGW0_PRUDU|nr:hypothetical protein L3X38_033903 [Prunus dulcis]